MRAHVPEPQGAASTWPGPHTSALGDTPCASGSSWTRTLSTVVLPTPGTSMRSWAFTASRTAIPRWAIRLHDGEDVADTDRDVERDLADALDLHHLIGQGHERGRPLQRDGTHAIAL